MRETLYWILWAALFGAPAFVAGRLSVDERSLHRRAVEEATAQSILDFQRAAYAAGFLRHEPIQPGEQPRWTWKTREQVWQEVDQEKIAEFTTPPPLHEPAKKK